MIKHGAFCALLLSFLTACSNFTTYNQYNQPKHLLFSTKEINTFPLYVERDTRLCDDEKANDQNCPIKFYIDDFKAGEFYINNKTTYFLKSNEYELTVKNCKEDCRTFHTKITIGEQLPTTHLVLSIDKNGKPFIINKKS